MPAAIFSILCLLVSGVVQADSLRFSPDSRLVGEFKRLERGLIYFKTDATGTIPIELDNLVELETTQQLQFEMVDGQRHFGFLRSSQRAGFIEIETGAQRRAIPFDEIVAMVPIEQEFKERIDGEVNAGLNFTKGSEVLQTNFGVAVNYLTENYEFDLTADSIITRDAANESSQRSAMKLRTLRHLKGMWFKWSAGVRLDLERNDGLGTDLRSSLGVGLQRALYQSNQHRLNLSGGLLYTKERSAGEATDDKSIEGSFSIGYELFRYDSPEIDLTTKLEVIPNFTEWGRVRSNLDLTFKWEMYSDLFWRVSFYDSFDSDPPSLQGDRNDYGVVTGVAWEF